jgi:hypothetical protein
MSVDLWGPISSEAWRATPCIVGRVATQDDIAGGLAVFAIETAKPHRAWTMALPQCGLERRSDGNIASVIVIQAEEFNGKVLYGVRYVAGGNDVCTRDEIELLDRPSAGFFILPADVNDPG